MSAALASERAVSHDDAAAISVTIPLESRALLGDVAVALRELAGVIDAQCRRKGVSELEALVRVKFEVRLANSAISGACKRHGVALDQSLEHGSDLKSGRSQIIPL